MAELRCQLAPVANMTYWICALSVNQHATICHQAPNVDATGAPIHVCRCATPKHTCGSESEVNKFDIMMDYLRFASPGLRQVIAADADFRIFTRIWCIAELDVARKTHMPQHLMVDSLERLDNHDADLRKIDVRNAQASVESDRTMVLSKIKDKEEFNRNVQTLLFDPTFGLVSAWTAQISMATVF